MTSDELKDTLRHLGVHKRQWNKELRAATGLTRFTTAKWLNGSVPVPVYVQTILKLRLENWKRMEGVL